MHRPRISATLAILGVALAIGGCSGTGAVVGEDVPHWAGGEPVGAPAPPKALAAYPAVHDMPPARPTKLITVSEQTKLESELSTLRTQVSTKGLTMQQQSTAEQAASQDLAARASAVQSKAKNLRQQSQASEAERKKLEAIARKRARAARDRDKPKASAADAAQN